MISGPHCPALPARRGPRHDDGMNPLPSLAVALLLMLLHAGVGSTEPAPAPVAAATLDERLDLLDAALATLSEDELLADLITLTEPASEGRDTPSAGLDRAAEHIAARLSAAGYTGAGPDGSFRVPFERTLPEPDPDRCRLSLDSVPEGEDAADLGAFTLGSDFVPVWRCAGTGSGELVVLGFGIDSDNERYNDITGDLDGAVLLVASGEPRHKKKFEGEALSVDSDLYRKAKLVQEAGAAGLLVVRRPPEGDAPSPALSFRHTWASFLGDDPRAQPPQLELPVLEITPAVATALAGYDVLAELDEVDKKAKAPKPMRTGRQLSVAAGTREGSLTLHNVVGRLSGSDPSLASEHVVLGAHYDHLGVDSRGRVAIGADDNASGTAALLEIAEALASARPRRSLLVCAFAGEEDGLLGSRALAARPPVEGPLVAMINLDMLGFGDPKEVAVIGVPENPALGKLLERATKLRKSGVKKVVTGQGQEVFERSDHFPFHQAGVPVLFFFEGLPVGKNPHYHTWHDTLDTIRVDKIANTARLVLACAWLLTEDDERPPPPERDRR